MNYFDWADGRREFEQRSKVKHIVFAATDIVNDSFRLAAPKLVRAARRITIYASENDRALYLSKQVHYRSPVGRPDSAREIIVIDGMDSMDASDIDKALFFIDISLAAGHSYIFDKAKGLRDFSSALAGVPLTSRGVSKMNRGNSHYWKLIP